MRPWLKILAAGLLALVVLLLSAVFVVTRTETGAGWVLRIASGQIEGLEIGGHSGSIHGGLELREFRFGADAFLLEAERIETAVRTDWFPFVLVVERLEVEQLEYRALAAAEEAGPEEPPGSAALPFRLELPRLRLSGIRGLDDEGDPMFAAQSFAASASVHTELRLHEAELVIGQGTVTADGQLGLAEPFDLDFRLDAALAAAVEGETEPLLLDLQAVVSGILNDFGVRVSGEVDPPRFQPHTLAAGSRISANGIETDRFEITGPDLRARGTGAVDWADMAARIEGLQLEIPGTDFTANAELSVDPESERLEGRIAWNGLSWPLRGDLVEWTSREGDIRISGALDDWSLEGKAELEAPGYPAGWLDFDAAGDRGGLEAVVHEAEILGGRLHGSGSYRWDEGGAFTAELALRDLATEQLAPDYPAVLSGELSAGGRLEPLAVSLDVRDLHGVVLGRPVSASGGIEVSANAVSAKDLGIRSGASSLLLNGFPDDGNGLAFSANIADLGDFLQGGVGVLNAEGTLHMQSGWPVLIVDARGSDIGWRNVHVSSLAATGGNGGRAGADSIVVSLAGARLGDTELDGIDARIVFGPDRQALDINAVSGTRRANAQLTGAIAGGRETGTPWNWSGELLKLELALSEQDRIHLAKPVAVRFSAEDATLETACLAGSRGAGACLEAVWSDSGGAEATANIERWPLDSISEVLGLQVRLSQHADGTLRMSLPPSGKPSGSADFRITAGTVSYAGDPEPLLETGDGALAFTLTGGRLTSGVIDIPIPGQGLIDLDYDIPDVTRGLDAELRGTLLIDMSDLDVISVMVPRVDRVSGSLKADLVLGGSVRQPYFRGALDLHDGVLENRASGLKLEDITLSGSLSGDGQTVLTGGFRAAEGAGSLEALVDLRDIQQPKFELNVSGEKLKLFDSNDLTVVIDPDLSVAFEPGTVTIGGEIGIPSALVAPAVIPEQTIAESPDLVITAGRPAGEVTEQEESRPVSILGGLKLRLGDDVRLDLKVAELGVTGAVDFDWQGGAVPVADGGFNLSGEILAFGQLLDIAQGDIGFPGVPADNPHLNIRAEREIFGNSEVRRAGLLIAGTVRRPVIEPYTDPMTNRDRAQTLLVTGSDFNMERGVGAVDIGTYIAPRIFVSYGVGVFDDDNILSIRYDLGRGWGIKATSGERQTGVDISYTVDQ